MAEPLLFIIGVPRSGTTLLATLLEGHPAIYVDNEAIALRLLRLRERLGREAASEAIRAEIAKDNRLSRFYDDVETEGQNKLGAAFHLSLVGIAEKAGKQIYLDKSPDAIPVAERLAGLFPGARFLHVVRDPRPTVASLVSRQYLELNEAAMLYREWTEHALGLARWWPAETLLRIRYEDLVARPEETLRSTCKFLQLPYHNELLQLGTSAATTGPGAYVKSSFDVAKLEGWKKKMSARDVATIESICRPVMSKLGYPLVNAEIKEVQPGYWKLYRHQVAHKVRLLMKPTRKQMIARRLEDRHVSLSVRLGAVGKAILRGLFREELLGKPKNK